MPTAVATAAAPDEFISVHGACRITGISSYKLFKEATLGRVRVLAEPGSSVKFHRGDVLGLVKTGSADAAADPE